MKVIKGSVCDFQSPRGMDEPLRQMMIGHVTALDSRGRVWEQYQIHSLILLLLSFHVCDS